jgi:radical SAM superfamily enzyme YgiQ (UPF0313 family)
VAPQKKRIYLINPKTPENFWAMQGTLDIVGRHKTLMPNAALLTLAALTPAGLGIEYVFCDENLAPARLDLACDLVAITGYTLQAERIRALSDAFHARQVPVAIGGVFATLEPERARPLADHLFLGEAELTWPRFLVDWLAGRPGPLYRQEEFIDLKDSPPPDLSYVKASDYLYFSVQTCRGCPNNCDFCDVVRLVGRKFRSKTIAQIVREVKAAHACGAETVFFSDDNFLVNRNFTVELLRELVAWNRTLARPLSFSTQATVQIGADDEILKLLADARFSVIFLGLETLRKECLDEVNKGQMARFDPRTVIPRLGSFGIMPFLGMIVGFDHDTPAVFGDIESFLDETGSPIASISVLNAPRHTELYRRMQAEGRLQEEFRGFWHLTTNIVPKGMTLQELYQGHKALFQRLYEPERFERRMIKWLGNVRYLTDLYSTKKKTLHRLCLILRVGRHFLFRVPPAVRRMFWNVVKSAWRTNPRLISRAVSVLVQYWHYYDFARREAWRKAGLEESPLDASPRAAGEGAAKPRGQGGGRVGPEVPAGLRGGRA